MSTDQTLLLPFRRQSLGRTSEGYRTWQTETAEARWPARATALLIVGVEVAPVVGDHVDRLVDGDSRVLARPGPGRMRLLPVGVAPAAGGVDGQGRVVVG